MSINVPREGEIWKLAVATLGAHVLQDLVERLLKSYVKTRKVDNLGFLRLEWLGFEALEALRTGYRLAGTGPHIFGENPNFVALPNGHRSHLLRGLVLALPVDRLPVDLVEWRLQLDLGI
jgi:hypothetical protein